MYEMFIIALFTSHIFAAKIFLSPLEKSYVPADNASLSPRRSDESPSLEVYAAHASVGSSKSHDSHVNIVHVSAFSTRLALDSLHLG